MNLKAPLFLLRLSIFVVMLVWTLDKFIRPEHAATVFQAFYHFPKMGHIPTYVIGALESILLFTFLVGLKKKFSYGAVFFLHFISTASCYKQYLAPFEKMNLLFFAALPMLAGCWLLFVLRDEDTLLQVSSKKRLFS